MHACVSERRFSEDATSHGMRCLAIDPGSSSGWALYENRLLVACGACRPHEVWIRAGGPVVWVERVYYEKPVYHPGSPVNPQNLITLADNAGEARGAFVSAGAKVDFVFSDDWKGQLPKKVCHARSWAVLTEPERSVVGACGRGLSSKPLLDMLDAVALGQHALATRVW